MDYNPFTARHQAAQDKIEELERHRADLVEQLEWATGFIPEVHTAELAIIISDLDERIVEHGRLTEGREEIASTVRALDSQTTALQRGARLGLNVFRWFTTEYDVAQARLKAHTQECLRMQERLRKADLKLATLADEVAGLTDQKAEREAALARFSSFRPHEAVDEVASIDSDLLHLEKQRDHLVARAAEVERAVEGPLAELRAYESDLHEHEAAISRLKSKLSTLEGEIADAERIDLKISNASNKYEQALLHQECERRFGEGSPRAAIRAIRSQRDALRGNMRDLERQVVGISRDLGKTQQRIRKVAERAARDVRALVIDGNNCAYAGGDFIGLTGLVPMTDELAKRYEVTIVFDASIRSLLRASDAEIRAAFPSASVVHVVASRMKADETILDAADSPTDWVISNDRFGDYRDKRAIREGRVIRHEILRNRVLVHDLGVNLTTSDGTTGKGS